MNEELLRYLFPILIALILVNFGWALIVTAVKGPDCTDEKNSGRVDLNWRDLDAGPVGERRTIGEKIKPKIKREA